MVFSKKWLRNHENFLLHFLIHIDVLMLCSKFEPIPTSIFQVTAIFTDDYYTIIIIYYLLNVLSVTCTCINILSLFLFPPSPPPPLLVVFLITRSCWSPLNQLKC